MLYAENKVATDELRRNEYLFWGVALLLCVLFIGRDGWWGSEALFAEAVREMMRAPGWPMPTLNYEPIDGVPLPLLWEGVLFGKLFGISEWSLRLVTSLNALGLLAGTMALAKCFFDRRVALLAGVLLLGSCGFLYTGRLFLGVIPATTCGIWAVHTLIFNWKKAAVIRPLLFALLLLLAIFFGTFYAALPILAAGSVLYFADDAREKPHWGEIVTWCIAVAIIAAAVYFGWEYGVLPPEYPDFSGNFPRNFLRALCWDGIRVFFPWSLWGIAALVLNGWRFRKTEKNFRVWLLAAVAVWLVCVIPAMGNWRQMVCLLPPWSILTAATLAEDRQLSRLETILDVTVRYLTMVTGAVAVASIVVIPVWKILFKVDVAAAILGTVPAAGLIAQTFLLFNTHAAIRFALPRRCGGTVLAALTLTAAALCVIRPNFATLRTGRSFISGYLNPVLKNLPDKAILYYGSQPDAAVLYYGDTDGKLAVTGNADRIATLRHFLADNVERVVAVIADADAATEAELAAVGAEFSLNWEKPTVAEAAIMPGARTRRLTLYRGSVVAKKAEESTFSKKEEKP